MGAKLLNLLDVNKFFAKFFLSVATNLLYGICQYLYAVNDLVS